MTPAGDSPMKIRFQADADLNQIIQGDFGAVYLMVTFAFSAQLIPVYATTERAVEEKRMSDNTVRSERVFRHKIFRKYESQRND